MAVLVLSIIAAIVLPSILNAKVVESAESALLENLSRMAAVIQRYAADHGGTYPGAVSDGIHDAGTQECMVGQLALPTSHEGHTGDVRDSEHPLGPYMLGAALPICPVGENRGSRTVHVVQDAGHMQPDPSPTHPWKYSTTSGKFICNTGQLSSNDVPYFEW